MIRLLVGALATLMLATACSGDDAPLDAPESAIASGDDAIFGRDEPEAGPACFLAIDEAEVERLWQLGGAGNETPPPPVPVDLDPPVVGLFLGASPAGASPPRIVTVDLEGDAAVIDVAVTDAAGPPAGGAREASPYAVVAVPADAGTARVAGDLELNCADRVPELPGSGEVEDDEVGS